MGVQKTCNVTLFNASPIEALYTNITPSTSNSKRNAFPKIVAISNIRSAAVFTLLPSCGLVVYYSVRAPQPA